MSPKDFITAMYLKSVEASREAGQSVDDFDYFRIDVDGTKDGKIARVTYYVKTWNDLEKGLPSARDTSVPPSIVADWLVKGKIDRRGTLPPEACIEPEPFFRELAKRKILVEEEMQRTKTYY